MNKNKKRTKVNNMYSVYTIRKQANYNHEEGLRHLHRLDGEVVRALASQSVDLEFISQVESYQKTLKNGIHSFPDWLSA